ncbi:hypothetical protein I4U23_021734 [Adineta vaga]|nr:hypothetical protein I4U23_021734 [Adineta vaga]
MDHQQNSCITQETAPAYVVLTNVLLNFDSETTQEQEIVYFKPFVNIQTTNGAQTYLYT